MQRFKALLEELGHVRAFDYAYMKAGKRAPDRMPALLDVHRQELNALKAETTDESGPVVLVGKSMGGRMGCHLSLEGGVDAVICLGYPLQGIGKSQAIRDQVLIALTVPALFIQGTRDKLCPLDLLESTRARMSAPSSLFVVQAGDHSLQATKTQLRQDGTTQDELERGILVQIQAFCRRLRSK